MKQSVKERLKGKKAAKKSKGKMSLCQNLFLISMVINVEDTNLQSRNAAKPVEIA